MQVRTTSTHRTYRYVRVSLVALVVFLGVGVGVQVVLGGPLESVSSAYYTPARNVFVGALCAVSLALLALSGRSLEQALLDLAAVLAPVIALVPTPIHAGSVPGVDPGCTEGASCVPPTALADVTTGMLTLSIVGAVAVVGAVALGLLQRTLTAGVVATIVAAGILVQAGTAWWALSPATFLAGAHSAATLGFFAIVAAVAAIAALRPAGGDRRRRLLRIGYAAIAAAIVADLLFLAAVIVLGRTGPLDGDVPLVFVGEAVALLLFAVFWLVQTVELWPETDPAILSPAWE